MRWGRASKPRARVSHAYDASGIRFFVEGEVGASWWCRPQDLAEVDQPLASYLDQLLLEAAASGQDGGLAISWDSLYVLLKSDDHAGSVGLLRLPQLSDWVPRIQTHGALSDSDFRLAVACWSSPTLGEAVLVRTGAVLSQGGRQWLMPETSWRLLGRITEFARDHSHLDADGVLRIVGEIQKAAKACGAPLDDFLERTDIRTPDKLRLELKREEALGSPVIEVRPLPDGVPANFVETFDRYSKVRSRYDLIQPEGKLTHVAPSPGVRDVLSAIKAMPARRMSAEQARIFAHNPYAVLGGDAADVLDEEDFNQARREAGLLPSRLEVRIDESDELHASVGFMAGGPACDDEIRRLGPDQVQQLLAAAGQSRARALPVFHWDGTELVRDPAAEQQLALLADWLARSTATRMSQPAGAVLDLGAFSSRVIGFDSKVQAVPYVAHRTNGKDWLPDDDVGVVTVDVASGNVHKHRMTPDSVQQLVRAIGDAKEQGRDTVTLPDSPVEISVRQAEMLVEELRDVGLGSGEKPLPKTLSDPKPNQRVGLKILHNIESLEYVEAIEQLVGETRAGAVELPTALRPETKLLPHQAFGLAWMQQRYLGREAGIAGCLLADDMGLGKTLQSLSLIAWAGEKCDFAKPSLVVAPVSLLENWKLEVQKFLGWPPEAVLSLYGTDLAAKRAAPQALDDELRTLGVTKLLLKDFADGYRLVLTTYETLRDYELSIARQHWNIVVCDEAQKIKNPTAFVTQAAKALRADFKIACTGTPVENSLADLWCLFDFFQPGCLGALNDFTKAFRESIESRQDGHEALVERLRALIQPWVLRRMKDEVHDGLPRKLTGSAADPLAQALKMSPVQQAAYMDAVAAYRKAKEQGGHGRSVSMLNLLHRLRMICAHPLAVLRDDHERIHVSDHVAASPKLAWLLDRLAQIQRQGEKAIVFTDYRDLQRLLQRAMADRFGFRPQIINGSTAVGSAHGESRQHIIDAFQRQPGFGVLLLSASAVGFGVNIQEANHVIHFTRTWNPAKEDQATDRAYRIGQKRDVYVYCPTVAGPGFASFEERLAERLDYKRELSRDMLNGSQELSVEDFEDL